MKKLLSIILALVLLLSMVSVGTMTIAAEETNVDESESTTENDGTTENIPENENGGENTDGGEGGGNTDDNTGGNENIGDGENTDDNENTGDNNDDTTGGDNTGDGEGSDEIVDETVFKWVLDGTVLTISGKCEMPAFDEVPAEWGSDITEVIITDGITNIGKAAFKDMALLTKVTIPNSVTKIDASAFEGCIALTEITIPDSVVEIGESAFASNTSLQNITFGIGLSNIGNGAFSGCEKLQNVYLTYLNSWCNTTFGDEYSSPLAYAENLYHNDKLLTSVNIPEGVTEIKYGAFSNCKSIENVTIPATVTAIGKSAFVGCSALSKVTLSESVISIGENAFAECENLKDVVLFEGLVTIENGAFRDCTALNTIVLPKTLTSIGGNAFRGCETLVNITIPEGVTSIGELAFSDCYSLNRVTFPANEIAFAKDADGNHVFANSNYVMGVSYKESATAQYLTDCNIEQIYIDTEENLVSGKVGRFEWNLDKITGLLQIDGEGEMMDFTYASAPWSEYSKYIANLKLSEDITYIGEKAFEGTFIFSLEIPENIVRIGDYAFSNSPILRDLKIGDSVTRIDAFAFDNCKKLTNVTIGDSVEIIDYLAFGGCENIKNVYITDLTAWCDIDFEYFMFNQSNPLEFAENLYLNNELVVDLKIPFEAKRISSYAFYRFENLQSIAFLGELESIGKSAFEGCSDITAIILPFNVKLIEADAFAACENLKEITVYNKNVELKGEIGFNNTQTFYGYAGTTVEAFATEIGATFVDISESHEHKFRSATCAKPVECETCGLTVGEPLAHTYENVCDTQCDACGHVRAPLHDYDNACDTKCGVCGEEREVPDHAYKKYKTTDATTSKNGKKYYECKECGKTKTSTIYKIDEIKLSTTLYTYNGKTKKPSVKIYDSKGNKLEYDVDYTYKRPSSSKKVGNYKIKVTFKGDYTGSTTLYYMINPPKAKISEVTAGTKSLKVKIKKQSEQVTGYQVQYSTSKSFATVGGSKVITSYKTTSHTFKNLKAKKYYYVRVRTYKKVDGVIYYSDFSDVVKKKTK